MQERATVKVEVRVSLSGGKVSLKLEHPGFETDDEGAVALLDTVRKAIDATIDRTAEPEEVGP